MLKPKNLDEFRKSVPLTTYKDYRPFIGKYQEDVLFDKPCFWTHTSGDSGDFEWVPFFQGANGVMCKNEIAIYILTTAKYKGDVNIHPGISGFINFPPRALSIYWRQIPYELYVVSEGREIIAALLYRFLVK